MFDYPWKYLAVKLIKGEFCMARSTGLEVLQSVMRPFIAIHIVTLSTKVVDSIVYYSSAIENKNTLDKCGTSREKIEK